MSRFASVVALLLAVALAPAEAQIPNLMSYQGAITDDLGNPVSDGPYDLTFRLFDVANGGVAHYTEVQVAVPVSKGAFSVMIGSVTSLANVPFNKPYWLEVQVGADAPLVPRMPLGASPYANHLRLPFSGQATSTGGAFTARNLGTGPAIVADGRIEAGGAYESGELRLKRLAVTTPFLTAAALTRGGSLSASDENAASIWSLAPDVDGTGAFFAVQRAPGLAALTLDGNSGGTEEPLFTLGGDTRAFRFDSDAASGDASLMVPTDAISSVETADEPGLAAIYDTGADLSFEFNVHSRTITVPAPGYVVAVAHASISLEHEHGVTSQAVHAISDAPDALPQSQLHRIAMPSNAASGTYHFSAGSVAAFEVDAGAHTFYNIYVEDAGDYEVHDPTMILMYFPTAYGTVSTTASKSSSGGATPTAVSGDPEVERAEARAHHLARLDRELGRMREELDRARAEMAATVARQESAGR